MFQPNVCKTQGRVISLQILIPRAWPRIYFFLCGFQTDWVIARDGDMALVITPPPPSSLPPRPTSSLHLEMEYNAAVPSRFPAKVLMRFLLLLLTLYNS